MSRLIIFLMLTFGLPVFASCPLSNWDETARLKFINDGDTIAFGGFVATGIPEEIFKQIEETFIESQQPKDLTIMYAAG